MSQERPHSGNSGEPDDEVRQHRRAFENPPSDRDQDEWLANHPAMEGAFADLHILRDLYQGASPPEPSAAQWDAAQQRVHATLSAANVDGRRVRRPYWVVFGSTAAAVFISLLLARALWFGGTPQPRSDEPLPVVEQEDITIVSMDARDVNYLVVGEPPVSGELVFARPEDIHVVQCSCCPISGQTARLEKKGEVPMFVAVAAGGGGQR